MKPSRRFESLDALLTHLDNEIGVDLFRSVPRMTWLVSIVIFLAGLGIAFASPVFSIPALIGILGSFGVFFVWAGLSRKYETERNPQLQRKRNAFKAVQKIRELAVHRRLQKWMDPVALTILDAAAFHWQRINAAISTGPWLSADLAPSWKQLRENVTSASMEALYDLLIMASNCIGPPQKNKASELQGVLESFVDLDWVDAMQGLKSLANSDWTAYAHQSPQAETIAVHGRQIAEKMKALADDIESKSQQIVFEAAFENGLPGLSAIESVLGEMRSFQQAEDELDQELRNNN